MAIDRFSVKEFEEALPVRKANGANMWEPIGMVAGEMVYSVPAGSYARIMIRSSIDESGIARDTGDDSIRLWLEVFDENGTPHGVKKLDTYTTRVPGWEQRMHDKLAELYKYGARVKRPIPMKDGKSQAFWFTKGGPNEGRPASKDFRTNTGFTWMDEEREQDGEGDYWEPSLSAQMEIQEDDEPEPIPEGASYSDIPEGDPATGIKPTEKEDKPKSVLDELRDLVNAEFKKKDDELGKKPSKQQMAAILAPIDVPVRVLASAGSGKTFVLERRYTYVLANGFEPNDIVVVTHTKDMSKEMATRIIAMNPQVAGTQGETQICSIHAFCNRVLQSEGIGLRIPDKSYEVKRMLQDIAKQLWNLVNEADKSTCRPTWEELLKVFSNAKYRGLPIDSDYTWYEEMWGGYHADRLTVARNRFDSTMKGKHWWTFSDMLFEMEHRLLNDADFRQRVQSRYKYLMIDEGQDTNGQAMSILTTVAAPQNQIFIVGDPDQMMFRFIGATPEDNLYDGFSQRYPNGETYFLETNYRSTHNIVDTSNELIAYNYVNHGGPYDEAFRKECTAREGASSGESLSFTMYQDAAWEAIGVGESIVEQINLGRQPGDIFVASRTRAQLGQLEPVLTKFGVPFINITGGSFWMLRHVKHILSYLRLAMDGNDEDSFRHIYNVASNNMIDRYGEYCPTRWLGNSFLRAMDRTYESRKAMEASYNYSGWRTGVEDLVWTMDHVEDLVRRTNPEQSGGEPVKPDEIVRWIIDNSVNKYLKVEEGLSDNEDIGKLADLEVVADVASLFPDLESFFERIDAAIQAAKDAKAKRWEEYVVLSTAHRLKGMERPVVFGIGWCEGYIPIGDDAIVPSGLLPHTFSLTEPPQNGVLEFGGKSRVEDERCIGYVIITRAQEECFLSGCKHYRKSVFGPSRFVQEIGLA